MIKKVIEHMQSDPKIKEKIEHIEIIPERKALTCQLDNLPKNIRDYLKNKDIKLYKHQCKTAELLRNSENVLITTPTASGKTMAFNLPILEKFSYDPTATALYIYPAKALANDQLKVLRDLETDLSIYIKPNIYDGDTPKDQRPWIRKNSRIILTNPYELHLILAWHYQWAKFYSNLKYIVIDEAHHYRGVFGSNVAFLIRRLRRICNFYGSDPQFILSSATLANPLEFSKKLVGKSFKLVDEDGSPKGRKFFVLYNPYNGSGHLSTHQETKNLFLLFIIMGLQTLCFTISRRMAEIIANWSKNELNDYRPDLIHKITAYRAGYLPEDRRKIEEELKNGDLIGVTTTNALEMGINIGSLDAVIISGFPGTIISTWQQAGRSGRGTNDSMVVLLAFENPLDQYFMKNPDFLFDRPHENAIIDLENVHIIKSHLLCTCKELPLNEDEMKNYFTSNPEFLVQLKNQGLISKDNKGWIFIGRDNPAFNYGLDQISSDIFKVFYKNQLIERMERSYAYREAHEGAVLINKGETYIVDGFDQKKRNIYVTKKDVDYNTQVMVDIEIQVLKELNNRIIGDLKVYFGELEVTEFFNKYKLMNYGKTLAVYNLDLPPIKFQTKGLWFKVPFGIRDLLIDMIQRKDVFEGGLHGVEHAFIAMMPLHVMCDQFDIGGLSTSYHNHTHEATIFIYDAYQGGIGLAEKALELFENILKISLQMVKNCKCREGCPSCIYSPKCGNDNTPLNKKGTIFILNNLLKMVNSDFKVLKAECSSDKIINHSINTRGRIGSDAYKDVDASKILNKKGIALFENEKYDEALEIFEHSLIVEPSNIEALKYKGMILEIKEIHNEAIKVYNQAIRVKPDNAELLYLKALSLYNMDEVTESIQCLELVIHIEPDFDDAWYLLGLAHEIKLHKLEAVKCYSKALSINPENSEAMKSLKKLFDNDDEYE
ncbi:MAG: DEAD/DEAH box helicase [Methanobacteriaceae archaeon]|nr:DEAD/DEAH box helicase [Methanobacteriaceae archaeon]